MAKKDLILIGGGGHCKSCIDVIEAEGTYKITGIVEVEEKFNQNISGYKVIASDKDLPALVKKYKNFFIAIGSIKDPSKRIEKFEYLKRLGARFPVIVSPLAHVSRSALVGEGTIIMHQAVVNVDAKLGHNCIINTSAIIEHDVILGDHSHISPGAIVNGTCHIGKGVFVGSNAVIANNKDITDKVVIGAGALVVKSISKPGIYIATGKLVRLRKI